MTTVIGSLLILAAAYARATCVDKKDHSVVIPNCECHESCETCALESTNDLTDRLPTGYADCLTCPDGADVGDYLSLGRETGFCGPACELCFDGAKPARPEANYSLIAGYKSFSCEHWHTNQLDIPGPGHAVYGSICSSTQAEAYYKCGCPTVPPAPQEGGCTLCADGSAPKNPENFLTLKDEQINRKCADLRKTLPVSVVADVDSYDSECITYQSKAFLDCGCPTEPEPKENPCTICFDGSEPRKPNNTVSSTSTTYRRFFNEFYEGATCGEAADLVGRFYSKNDDDLAGKFYCEQMQAANWKDDYCGCPEPPSKPATPASSVGAVSKVVTFCLLAAVGSIFSFIFV